MCDIICNVKSKDLVMVAEGKAKADAFMSKFADYETTATYRRRREALDERQAKSLAKDFSGERKGGIMELRNIPGFIEKESSMRKENVLHLAMMEAKKRSGLTQTEIASRLGMPQPNVSRIEHSEVVTFNTFSEYIAACGFDFTIKLHPMSTSVSIPALNVSRNSVQRRDGLLDFDM